MHVRNVPVEIRPNQDTRYNNKYRCPGESHIEHDLRKIQRDYSGGYCAEDIKEHLDDRFLHGLSAVGARIREPSKAAYIPLLETAMTPGASHRHLTLQVSGAEIARCSCPTAFPWRRLLIQAA